MPAKLVSYTRIRYSGVADRQARMELQAVQYNVTPATSGASPTIATMELEAQNTRVRDSPQVVSNRLHPNMQCWTPLMLDTLNN